MSDLSLLVVSCDAYDDLWPAFFKLFDQCWPECQYPVYLQTNHKEFEHKDLKTIKVGQDIDWSSNLKLALSQIPTKYVLVLLEDFFLCQPVDRERIRNIFDLVSSENAGYCRLVPKPSPDVLINRELNFGKISKGQNYRMSFQASIWSRTVLMDLLIPGENPWKAEMEGSKRSNELACEFFSVGSAPHSEWPMHYMNAVIKRKWTPEAVQFCRENNILLDLKKRQVCDWYDQLRRKRFFRTFVSKLISGLRFLLGDKLYSHFKNNRFLKKLIY